MSPQFHDGGGRLDRRSQPEQIVPDGDRFVPSQRLGQPGTDQQWPQPAWCAHPEAGRHAQRWLEALKTDPTIPGIKSSAAAITCGTFGSFVSRTARRLRANVLRSASAAFASAADAMARRARVYRGSRKL